MDNKTNNGLDSLNFKASAETEPDPDPNEPEPNIHNKSENMSTINIIKTGPPDSIR